MAAYIVDTNFFIQCSLASDLSWHEITTDDEIILLVPRAVQEEIDRLKQDGSSRRSKRARLANRIFRDAVRDSDLSNVVREKSPVVKFTLLERLTNNSSISEGLDITRADDWIVADALSLLARGCPVSILTGDTGIMLTAKQYKVPFIEVPDGWLLPPEPDKRSKEISELRRRVDALERTAPNITTTIEDGDDNVIDSLEVNIIEYENKDKLIEEGVALAQSIFKMEESFDDNPPEEDPSSASRSIYGLPFAGQWQPPTRDAIRRYQEETYPRWIGEVRRRLQSWYSISEEQTRTLCFEVVICNNGNRPAENVVVEVEAKGGVLLTERDSGIEEHGFILPEVPVAPAGRWVIRGDFSSVANLSSYTERMYKELNDLARFTMPVIEDRDRYSFYWKPERPSGRVPLWRFECKEFRHRIGHKKLASGIYASSKIEEGRKAVEIRVSAANISEPVIKVIPVMIKKVNESGPQVMKQMFSKYTR